MVAALDYVPQLLKQLAFITQSHLSLSNVHSATDYPVNHAGSSRRMAQLPTSVSQLFDYLIHSRSARTSELLAVVTNAIERTKLKLQMSVVGIGFDKMTSKGTGFFGHDGLR